MMVKDLLKTRYC